MKILIIGGKKFLGYHIAKAAEAKGHEVVFFNRGKTYNQLLPHMNNIIGDRNKDMVKLKGMKFDAVIDTCAYFPNQVEKALNVLKDNVDRYLLISTLSAIKPEVKDFDESVEIIGLDFKSEEVTGSTYGLLKAACEKQLVDMLGDKKSLIFRPGYIVGERDHTDRFTYWPVMMKHMEKMIVPNTGDMGFKYVDVKDLAEFAITALEKSLNGIYHISGPEKSMKYADFIKTCHELINPLCKLIEVDDKWFEDNKLLKFIVFPTCDDIPFGHVVYSANTSKAFKSGFKVRSLSDTINDAIDWYMRYKGDVNDLAVGMKPKDMKKHIESL